MVAIYCNVQYNFQSISLPIVCISRGSTRSCCMFCSSRLILLVGFEDMFEHCQLPKETLWTVRTLKKSPCAHTLFSKQTNSYHLDIIASSSRQRLHWWWLWSHCSHHLGRLQAEVVHFICAGPKAGHGSARERRDLLGEAL